MSEKKWGGARPGAGRPSEGKMLTVPISVRISKEAAEVLRSQSNQSSWLNDLILNSKREA